MGSIALEQLEFFAYHGVSSEERKIGNRYSVNLMVKMNFSGTKRDDSIIHTVDYEKLYRIVKSEMKIPTKLLEHLAYRMVRRVFVKFPEVSAVEVQVSKFNPPIGGTCHKATVTVKEKRKNFLLTEAESLNN